MQDWDSPLSKGKSASDILRSMADSHTDKEIAKQLNSFGFKTSDKAVRSRRIRLNITKSQSDAQPRDTQSITGDTWSINATRTKISSVDELIASYKIDLRLWEVVEFRVSRYEVVHGAQATGGGQDWEREEDEWTVEPLHSIKAVVKRRPGAALAEAELASFREYKELIKKYVPKPVVVKRNSKLTDNMLELCLPDMHFGKVAWHPQTLSDDYDVSIARDIFTEATSTLVSQVGSYKFGEVLFVVGNDVFHTDNTSNSTTAGTPMDSSDTRYHRTFRIVREVMVDTIESLRSIAPVRVLVIPGNHDKMTAYHLGDSLECWFHRHKDVTVDNSPAVRKYHRWGNVFLLFTHGDKGKRTDYPQLMASEQPKDWGQTLYREIHTGDKHQVRVEEKFGIRVRILPSLSGVDAWHSENLFVGNQRQAEAFVWNKDRGLMGTAVYTYKA